MSKPMHFFSRLARQMKTICPALILVSSGFSLSAQTYEEGWYQIKRTVDLATIADLDLSNALSKMTSLMSDVSYLKTDTEFTSTRVVPVVDVNLGTVVYGARMLDVDGVKDYLASSGRNVNESEISTYFYITPVESDSDGEWQYTIRSANGHYVGTDGRYYATPQYVYIHDSLGISLGDSLDSLLNSLTSSLGVSVGSKQYTISTSFLDSIPFIDKLDIYAQIKPLIETLGSMGVKVSEDSWAKVTVANSAVEGDSIETVAAPGIFTALQSMYGDMSQLLEYYNEGDYTSIGRAIMKHIQFDLFKLKKVDLSNITTSVSLLSAKHTSVTPYTINLVGFGDNFELKAADYITADALTKISQKTNQNVLVDYLGSGAQDKSITRLYDGGTIFIKSKGTVGDGKANFSLVADNGTDLIDLSRSQYTVLVDDAARLVKIFVSSPKRVDVLGVSTGRWTDNYKTVSLDESGVLTLSSPFELTIPADEKNLLGKVKKAAPKVFAVTSVDGHSLGSVPVKDRIPANTPVVVKGAANQNYNFTVVDESDASATPIDSNLLTYSFVDYEVPDGVNVYVLSTTGSATSASDLELAADDGATSTSFVRLVGENRVVPAWQAYFETDADDDNDSYSLILNDDSTTSIDSIVVDNAIEGGAPVIYDIYGRRVSPEKVTLGLYIINGVKTLVP